MSERTVNVPLLRKAVEWAEAEAAKPAIDSRWEQSTWMTTARTRAMDLLEEDDMENQSVQQVAEHCGTAFCIAGYVGQLLDERYMTNAVVNNVHVSDFAAEALGVPASAEDGDLFSGWNTIEDVRRIAEELAGERL